MGRFRKGGGGGGRSAWKLGINGERSCSFISLTIPTEWIGRNVIQDSGSIHHRVPGGNRFNVIAKLGENEGKDLIVCIIRQ